MGWRSVILWFASDINLKRKSLAARTKAHRKLLGAFEPLEGRRLLASIQLDANAYSESQFLVQVSSQGRHSNAWTLASDASNNPFAQNIKEISSDGWFEVRIPSGSRLDQVLAAYRLRTDVLTAVPDFRVSIDSVPNDPAFSNEWGLQNTGTGGLANADIGAPIAWNYGTTTATIVAVIDTGIDYNHVDLASNIWRNTDEIPGNGKDDDGNGYVDDIRGWNFVANNNNPMDDNGHGTHVAGTIGALGNNGIGIAGIAWNVQLMPLKFLGSDGTGALSDAISAIDYARSNGAKLINASWGGSGFSSALQAAVQRFQNAGGIFVTAAGNSSSNNASSPNYPANLPLANVISVAASTSSDTLASYSNYGSNVDIAAPGSGIYSTIPGNRYAYYSGTSMATPHVTGALALLWGQSPSLTASQLIDLVMSSTDNVLRNVTQFGRLDVGNASIKLHGGQNSDTIAPQVLSTQWIEGNQSINEIRITFSEPVSASSLRAAISIAGPTGLVSGWSLIHDANDSHSWSIQQLNANQTGPYRLTIAATVTDSSGNRLNQDGDSNYGEATQDQYISTHVLQISNSREYSASGPVLVPDASRYAPGRVLVPINVPDTRTIDNLTLTLNLQHTYVGDLRVRLIAPDGTSILLFQRRGGSRDDLNITFDQSASKSVAQELGNFRGSYRPEQSLGALTGLNAKGRWLIEITDWARGDVGTLRSATLTL